MPFKIVRNDITKMKVDAIVNTANSAPIYSDGVDTAVYEAAGVEELLAERRKIGFMEHGEVAITPGFQLPAKYIIHAVSPFYIDGQSGEEQLLCSCYSKSLQLAYENHCESIAFPLIATGSFGYPKEEGMRIALDEINAFLLGHEMLIYLVVFDTQSTKLGHKLYPDLEAYIDQNYVSDQTEREYGDRSIFLGDECLEEDAGRLAGNLPVEKLLSSESVPDDEAFWEEKESALKERMKHLSDTFQQYLLYLIEQKGMTNAEVYNRAFITKQLFSKIKQNPYYHPDKVTALRLCVGAKLNLDETKDLLARAGYALSPCDRRDIIFSYFIEKEVYDIVDIDIALEDHGLEGFLG